MTNTTPWPTAYRPKTLRQKQSLFIALLAELIQYAESLGYQLTLGEGYIDLERVTKEVQKVASAWDTVPIKGVYGHKLDGCHPLKLAQDLNLFLRGRWISTHHPAWDHLGAFWKSLCPLCCWGGDFKDEEGNLVGDYNHFSLKHGGRK